MDFNYTGPLRPLREAPHSDSSKIQSEGSSMSSPASQPKFTLSADAPVFVPQTIQSQHQMYNNQQQQQQHYQQSFPNQNRSQDDLSKNFNSMKLTSVQDRLNVRSFTQQPPLPNNFVLNCQQQQHQPQSQMQHVAHISHVPVPNGDNNSSRLYDLPQSCESLPNNLDINNIPVETIEPHDKVESSEEQSAIAYIESIVKCLNDNPGSYDNIAEHAFTIFSGFANNHFVLCNAMEIIFNKSIEEQNFRYMGAKLYNLLDTVDSRADSLFRKLLKCKLLYHQQEVLNYITNEQFKIRGTTLFLAELYMQLRNGDCQNKDIAQNIVYSMKQLLTNLTPENIKCICLTLKLAGYDLERDCPEEINEIIRNLRNVNAVDVSTSRILENVLNLQQIKWGRKTETTEMQSNYTPNVRVSDEPVFYGPDGQILTEEENSFLESNISNNPDDDIDSDVEYDPEMIKDAETELAYKAFLKNNCATK